MRILMGPIAMLTLAMASVSGCSDSPEDQRLRGQIIGGASGAAVGSLIGSGTGQAVAIGAGAVLGTIAGGRIAEDGF